MMMMILESRDSLNQMVSGYNHRHTVIQLCRDKAGRARAIENRKLFFAALKRINAFGSFPFWKDFIPKIIAYVRHTLFLIENLYRSLCDTGGR